MYRKKAQVWVETVIYTLIGLAIIGIVLAVTAPEINKYRDKVVIDQSVDMLNLINTKVDEVKHVAGNSRPLEINLKKGILKIDGINNEIIYELEDSRKIYSEPNQEISVGKVYILTETNGETKVTLKLKYDTLNIKYQNESIVHTLQPASQPYNLAVKNTGTENEIVVINFQ
jgi:type II secretory pathway pseudopilin PulG